MRKQKIFYSVQDVTRLIKYFVLYFFVIGGFRMKRAWCYVKSMEEYNKNPSKQFGYAWISGYVLNTGVEFSNGYIYSLFLSDSGEYWQYKYPATIMFEDPSLLRTSG